MESSPSRSSIVLAAVLRLLRPVVRLLLRHGVAYPAFVAALKPVFVEAARGELRAAGGKQTDSAVSLLSGVHRRDIRTMAGRAGEGAPPPPGAAPKNLASEVVARWLSDPAYLDAEELPRALARYGPEPSFDTLVSGVSGDIRARALLAELERLGIARYDGQHVRLLEAGFVPRRGFAETVDLMRDNLHDHIAAAAGNVEGDRNFLEQAVFVDRLSEASARHLHAVSAKAWRQAFRQVMREAQARYDHDQVHAPPAERVHRARFGSYFYSTDDEQPDS